MSTRSVSTRRRFFWKAGALLSAPLAAASTATARGPAPDAEALRARLAVLEDLEAIRELQQRYARGINAGDHAQLAELFVAASPANIDQNVRQLVADHLGHKDVIEIAADGLTASARLHCKVEIETAIGPSCPLVEMARLQGEGVIRSWERRVLETAYVKQAAAWKIVRSAFRSA